jgi:hypothetical protein
MKGDKPPNADGSWNLDDWKPEGVALLGMVFLAFVVIFVAGKVLAFVVVSILRFGGHSFTDTQTEGISTYVTRISGLIGTIVCFMSGVNYFFSLTTTISPYQRQLLFDS